MQFIANHYDGLHSPNFRRDFGNLFKGSKSGCTLWEHPQTRMTSARCGRRHDRNFLEKVFTPEDAAPLIVDFEMLRNRCSMCPMCTIKCVVPVHGMFNDAVEHIGKECVSYWCNIERLPNFHGTIICKRSSKSNSGPISILS